MVSFDSIIKHLKMKLRLSIFSLLLSASLHAQEIKFIKSESQVGDTIITVYSNFQNGKAVNDGGYHKMVKKELKKQNESKTYDWKEFLSVAYFDLDGNPAESSTSGYHRKEKYWKHYKFFNKNGDPVLYVKEDYWYEWSDAGYIVYEYQKNGDLKSVGYYKTDFYGKIAPAAEAYMNADIHKFIYTFDRKNGNVKEKVYSPWGNLVKIINYTWKGYK